MLAETDLLSYLPVAVIASMAIVFVVANIVLSTILGPRAEGAVKGMTYEAGMDPIGTTRKRFNVRFYMMAVTFLLFDVEIIFLYPWAVRRGVYTFSIETVPRKPHTQIQHREL